MNPQELYCSSGRIRLNNFAHCADERRCSTFWEVVGKQHDEEVRTGCCYELLVCFCFIFCEL